MTFDNSVSEVHQVHISFAQAAKNPVLPPGFWIGSAPCFPIDIVAVFSQQGQVGASPRIEFGENGHRLRYVVSTQEGL
jgi:hypothetical protein